MNAPLTRYQVAQGRLAAWAHHTPGEHVFALLIREAMRRVGNPDLADALAAVLAVYDDERAHFAAAEDLGQAARDVCVQHGIDV